MSNQLCLNNKQGKYVTESSVFSSRKELIDKLWISVQTNIVNIRTIQKGVDLCISYY